MTERLFFHEIPIGGIYCLDAEQNTPELHRKKVGKEFDDTIWLSSGLKVGKSIHCSDRVYVLVAAPQGHKMYLKDIPAGAKFAPAWDLNDVRHKLQNGRYRYLSSTMQHSSDTGFKDYVLLEEAPLFFVDSTTQKIRVGPPEPTQQFLPDRLKFSEIPDGSFYTHLDGAGISRDLRYKSEGKGISFKPYGVHTAEQHSTAAIYRIVAVQQIIS